jgi:ribosome-associated toxin RatA of RatAB toxin-antitoxin module
MKLGQLFLLLIGVIGATAPCGADSLFQPISFSAREKAGVDEVKAAFYVKAEASTAWSVLSDYENIPKFVPTMKKSRIEKRCDDNLLLTQEAEAGFLFITKRVHVLLKVHEIPGRSISFEDVSLKDFCFYQGSWNIQPCDQGGVSVVYELQAKKNFDAPFAGDYMNGGVKDLITAVQKEIQTRQTRIKSKTVN